MEEKTSFEAALSALEESVERLESGELSLEQSLACFEQGVQSAARCRKLLKAVETRVEVLLQDRDGNLTTAPLEEP
ncbi:exodeoxyribonuclease 7 small subunit [Desulfuromonas versatilis]|uniref:Exodeoxyribonuclease 7 small subunit n=1 Tax=Desulfuromonas versatilis TaxID=2802975 RepID=A0ABM8HUS6_9BACT|nr:exodeoxyribonuclease VII small subunit [Desulfuromonas versatilis]BCR05753.1 exodeoxyribonuclease 7 small subunit [Desulfuromonas versatilis]